MEKNILQSRVIDVLRFPMIVGVVLWHSFFEGIMGLDIPDSGIPIYHTTSFFISRILASVAVPLFFFISGYLFFFRTAFSVDVYKKKLKSRIKTLLIPYLFWNFVVLVGHWIVTVLSPVQLTSGAYKQVSDYTVCDYLISFWNINGMPVNGALWFIRDLMVMLAFSPLVYWCLRYFRWYILVVFGCIWLVGGTLEIPRMDAVFFFFVGAWFSITGRNFVADFKSFFPWGVALYFLFAIGTIGVRGADGFLSVANAGILWGSVSIIALTAYFVERERWKSSYFLISSCFLVYACHQLPLNMFVRILFKFMSPVSDWQFMLIYIVSPLVIILVNLLLYASLKKLFPHFTAIITGGRG